MDWTEIIIVIAFLVVLIGGGIAAVLKGPPK